MKNTDDAKQELLNAISSNTPRRSVGGIAINLAGRRGGSSGPTTYTKSVSNDDINKELTVTNVVDGIPQQPYKINYGELPIAYYETYDASKIISGFLTYFNSGINRGLWYKNQNGQTKKIFTIGEYPEGYITSITLGNNDINFTRQDLPTITYKPEIYKHSVGIRKSNAENEYVVIEIFSNSPTPPNKNELLTNKQLKWDFGVLSTRIDATNNWNVTYCRLRTDGTNFIILEGVDRITWNFADCLIVFDNVINLLDVEA